MPIRGKVQYAESRGKASLPSVELKDLESFIKVLETLELKIVFKDKPESSESQETDTFWTLAERVVYFVKTSGYILLEDFEDSEKNGFPDAETFYNSRSAGINNFREFQDFQKAGGIDKGLFRKAQKLGFVDGYQKFKEWCRDKKEALPEGFDPSLIDSGVKLGDFAVQNGFKDFGDFFRAFSFGFTNEIAWEDAKEKGFKFGSDYLAATKAGFSDPKEFLDAKHLNITSKYEYEQFLSFKKESKGIYNSDQVLFIRGLGGFENSTKLSVKKLREMLVNREEFMKTAENEKGEKVLPEWYTRNLLADEDIIAFLKGSPEIKNLGIYDEGGEYFEVWKISRQKIYVDASNVAHNSNAKGAGKPKLQNIRLVAEELKKQRFQEIFIIADATLKHKVEDEKILNDLRKEVKWVEAPAQTAADEFLIIKAKHDKCYIVSNDTFREWKLKDSWTAENIERIRIPFLIDGDKVSFSGLGK